MDLERDGNLIEAGVWFVLALALLIHAFAQPKAMRSVLLLLAVTLAMFGGSDLVEARTGAWWKPWWLFVWKALCVAGLLGGFVRYFKVRQAISSSRPPTDGTSSPT